MPSHVSDWGRDIWIGLVATGFRIDIKKAPRSDWYPQHEAEVSRPMTNLSTYELDDNRLINAWADLLIAQQWDVFATLTFKRPQFDDIRAVKYASGWLSRWIWDWATYQGDNIRSEKFRYDAYGRVTSSRIHAKGPFTKQWYKRSGKPIWACAVEKHRSGANHIHMLIRHRIYQPGTPNEISRRAGWDLWFNKMGMGRARVEPPENQADVARYCSEYVCKQGAITLSPTFVIDPRLEVSTRGHGSYPIAG